MRYLPLTDADRRAMLSTIGAASIDALFADVPKAAWLDRPVDLPPHQGELEVERALGRMAAKNLPAGSAPFFIGAVAAVRFFPARPAMRRSTSISLACSGRSTSPSRRAADGTSR